MKHLRGGVVGLVGVGCVGGVVGLVNTPVRRQETLKVFTIALVSGFISISIEYSYGSLVLSTSKLIFWLFHYRTGLSNT